MIWWRRWALRKSEREKFVGAIVEDVKKHVEDAGIQAQVDGRIKHFFSIYKKMVNQDKTIDQIYDLFCRAHYCGDGQGLLCGSRGNP